MAKAIVEMLQTLTLALATWMTRQSVRLGRSVHCAGLELRCSRDEAEHEATRSVWCSLEVAGPGR